MVASAYFTALQGAGKHGHIVDTLEEDIATANAKITWFPLDHDSLSPVAQELVQRDIPALLWPGHTARDRGIVLEEQWGTLGGTTFDTLERQERRGAAPFLVLTPTIVETGAPLFLSNLDLFDLGAAQLLCEHPEAKAMSLATAVRLNATFPYVSPAVAIPTSTQGGRERLVDAGYFDNYGLGSALAILSMTAVRRWIEQETSGIVCSRSRPPSASRILPRAPSVS